MHLGMCIARCTILHIHLVTRPKQVQNLDSHRPNSLLKGHLTASGRTLSAKLHEQNVCLPDVLGGLVYSLHLKEWKFAYISVKDRMLAYFIFQGQGFCPCSSLRTGRQSTLLTKDRKSICTLPSIDRKSVPNVRRKAVYVACLYCTRKDLQNDNLSAKLSNARKRKSVVLAV